jgi:hypothetical protein
MDRKRNTKPIRLMPQNSSVSFPERSCWYSAHPADTLHDVMPIAVTCYSCGKNLSVPDDYSRRKVRCPDCGVYCELPAERSKSKASAATGRAKPPASRVDDSISFSDVPDTPVTPPPKREPPRPTPPVRRPDPDEDDDGGTYTVTPTNERRCPQCQRELTSDAEVCEACGYDLQAGKKRPQEHEPRTWQWEAGMSFRKRRNIFIALQILPLTVGLATAVLSGYLAAYLTSWFGGALLLAFLLGTFPRVELSRTKRGGVRLTKTWRICFIPCQTDAIPWRQYEGYSTGKADDTDMVDWVMLFVLFFSGATVSWPLTFPFESSLIRAAISLVCGIFIDVLWWFYVIQRVTFYVALCKNHGYPEMMLYRGWDENMMQEMGSVIGEVTDLTNLSSGAY